ASAGPALARGSRLNDGLVFPLPAPFLLLQSERCAVVRRNGPALHPYAKKEYAPCVYRFGVWDCLAWQRLAWAGPFRSAQPTKRTTMRNCWSRDGRGERAGETGAKTTRWVP